MTISNFCSDALGEKCNAEDFKGKRMGLDLSIFINKFLFTFIDKLATTSNPALPAPNLLLLLGKVPVLRERLRMIMISE